MYAFGLPYTTTYDAYVQFPRQRLPQHHLTHNDFKYFPLKSCQTFNQLKNSEKQKKQYYFMFLIQWLKKMEGISYTFL